MSQAQCQVFRMHYPGLSAQQRFEVGPITSLFIDETEEQRG